MTNDQRSANDGFRPALLAEPPLVYGTLLGVQATGEQDDEVLWSILAAQPGYDAAKIIGHTDAVQEDGFRYIDVYVA